MDDLNSPLISIVVPVHNGAKYIEHTIKSVISQTYSNWELIIIDDGSSDKTPIILKKLADTDDRIKTIFLEKCSGGPAHPRNTGISASSGKYLAFLDADDAWDKMKLDKQIKHIMNGNFDLVHCKTEYMDALGEKTGVIKKSNLNLLLTKAFGSFFSLLVSNPISLSACIIKNTGQVRFRTDSAFHAIEDWFMWIDLACEGKKFAFLNETLVFYRIHDTSISHKNGLTQYYKSFSLYSLLLVENKIHLMKFLILLIFNFLRILKFKIYGRH